MKCPRCQHENGPKARFCQECAAPLARTCSKCGNELPSTAKFCPECAHPTRDAVATDLGRLSSPETYTPKHLAERILTSKAALEGERKQVTVLFADLKGSMELLADRDPEEARTILDAVLERMMEAVHRYEGTVNQVMGDGIMALFGAPLALEDHALRACYAALRMQDSVKRYAEEVFHSDGISIRIRVGMNSGEVVVRAIGSDLHMDYTAIGQTTYLAARMEQLADPGTVLLAPATHKLAQDYVEVKARGPVRIKGLSEPVEIFDLVGAGAIRSRLHAAVVRGLTPFVGRGKEEDQLRHASERADSGHGQLVAVVGEPGVGKSRLLYEFVHSPCTQGWRILETGSFSYGKNTAYLPIIGLLKAYFAIDERDDAPAIREKVTGRLLALDRSLGPTLQALLSVLDVAVEYPDWTQLEPPQRRERILEGVRRLLIRESRVQPLLVLVEDLHWIDSETQALLDRLVESLPNVRILLVVNYRPEYTHSWGSKTYYTQVRLDTLPAQSAEALLLTLLGDDAGLQPLKRLLIERTEGNPFFLEESVRTLVEGGVLKRERSDYRATRSLESIEVPATIQAVLASHIDRLSPADRSLLQVASVIGETVPLEILQAVAEITEESLQRALASLQAAEFLYEGTLYPELEYIFKHGLTYQVAYNSLLLERRRALHARIAETIERLYPGRLGEHIDRLAHHAFHGGLREKAPHYLRQAGLKAAARSALHEAQGWFERALEVLETLPEHRSTLEQAFDTRLELRPVLTQLGEVRQTLERLREAEALADQLNDDRRRGRASSVATGVYSQIGEPDEALESGTRALEISGRLGDLTLRILTTSYLEHAHYLRGEYQRVVELATANLAALPAEQVYEYFGGAAPPSVYDRSWLAMSLAQLGRFAEATEYEVEAIRLAERTQRAFTISLAYFAADTLYLLKGDWAKAGSLSERWVTAVRAGNLVLLLPRAVAASAWALAQLGEASEALNRLHEGEYLVERLAEKGLVGYHGWAYLSLGRASLMLGQLDEARRLGGRAVEFSRRQPGFRAHALHLLGDIATHPDRFDAESGEAHYGQALALAEPRGMRPLVAHCHLGLGKLYARTEQREQAREHLTTAATMYRKMDVQFYLEQAKGS